MGHIQVIAIALQVLHPLGRKLHAAACSGRWVFLDDFLEPSVAGFEILETSGN